MMTAAQVATQVLRRLRCAGVPARHPPQSVAACLSIVGRAELFAISAPRDTLTIGWGP